MRQIDADALKHSIAGNIPLMPTVRIAIEHRIDDMPTIEAEPVKHGRWYVVDEQEPRRYECTKCKRLSWDESNYCPNCGTRMDGGDA